MGSELRDYIGVLLKRRLLIVAAVVACLGLGAFVTVRADKVYRAQAKLFVGIRQVSSANISQGAEILLLSKQLLESYATLIKTYPVAERAVAESSLPLSPGAVSRTIQARAITNTQVMQLTYESTDPALAQRAVNAVAQAFVLDVENIEISKSTTDEPAVKVQIVEPARLPASPVRPQPVLNMILALFAGVIGGVVLAFIAEQLDTKVRGDDVEEVTGAPVLAAIPNIDTPGEDRTIHIERDPQSIAAESFRMLRTAVRFLGVDHPLRTILVTSPIAAEGKTTTALNLAASFAQAGMRTVLVEADLRRPTLKSMFPTQDERGLASALLGNHPVMSVTVPTPIQNLSVVPAGMIPPNPAELLSSDRMGHILASLRENADIIVIDSAPLLPVADTQALAKHADGVILIARWGKTRRDRLEGATKLVTKAGARLLGTVLNGLETKGRYGSSYYDRYGYYAQYTGYSSSEGNGAKQDTPAGRKGTSLARRVFKR